MTVKNDNALLNNQPIMDAVSEFVQELIETMISEQFVVFINRQPYERKVQKVKLSRNGYRYRNYMFIWSKMLRIKIPRCREAAFMPKLKSGGKQMDKELESMLIQIWLEGGSYRDIQVLVKRIYGERFSIGTFSKIVRVADKYVKQYHQRKITDFYDSVYLDGLSISIKGLPRQYDEYLRKKKKNAVFLGVLGQRKEKKKIIREMIDFKISQVEDFENYRVLLESLKSRGLKFAIAVHDGEESISKALKWTYGKVPQQLCLVHKMRNILNCLIHKHYTQQLRTEIWNVYSSPSLAQFKARKRALIRKWRTVEPEAIRLFAKNEKRLLSKYYVEHIYHKHIGTNNPIERYFREIRRRCKVIGCFENIQSADSLIFLIVDYLNQRRGSVPTSFELNFTH
jgi:transposase-like protein